MSTDAMRPLGGATSGATARLGASLHVKGEISGNEDLLVDGSVEGLIQLDDRKLTVGATAKVTADIIARRGGGVRCGQGQSARQGPYRDQEGWLGEWRFDHRAHHDRRRRVLQRLH